MLTLTPPTTADLIARMRAWSIDHLPSLNARALAGALSYRELAERINRGPLRRAADPADLDRDSALRLLLPLSFLGSSVERHAQQQQMWRLFQARERDYARRTAAVPPGLGLAELRVGGRAPFLRYFAAVADIAGHPHRDSLMTLVELNGPAVEVRHPGGGAPLLRSHVAFEDGRFLTFSDHPTEISFFTLGKLTVALQTAANGALALLQRPEVALDSPQAVAAALTAAELILAMRARILHFLKHEPFDTDFFLDVFRQYQCLWYADRYLKPPSAANDAASLLRDLILFEQLLPPEGPFPGFRGHAAEICAVLLPEQAAQIHAALDRPSLERRLLAALGLSRAGLAALDGAGRAALLAERPWLSAYLLLYNAQRDLSHAHYGLVAKYIIRPKRGREERGDEREARTVVNNARGTTGLDPMGVMVRLDEAREQHPLAPLSADPAVGRLAAAALARLGYAPLDSPGLLGLARLA